MFANGERSGEECMGKWLASLSSISENLSPSETPVSSPRGYLGNEPRHTRVNYCLQPASIAASTLSTSFLTVSPA